jgi:hypothetical protein
MYLDQPPHALAGFGRLLLGNLSSSLEHALCTSRDDFINKSRITSLRGREAVPLERKATNGSNLRTYESSERNGPSCTKVDLIHAHPGVAIGTVGHDAIVAGKGNYDAGGKAVSIDGSDSRDCKAMAISVWGTRSDRKIGYLGR